MGTRDVRNTARHYPELRAQFETSRALVQRARERAERAVQQTATMCALLRARAHEVRSSGDRQANIWHAAAEVLATSARERDRMLGVLSHELRQALGAALAAQRVLLADTRTDAARHAGAVLERQLLHLAKLVETLLDYSRLSLRSSQSLRDSVDVRDVVRQSVESVDPAAAEKALCLTVQLPATPQVVSGDRTRLRQAVSNLLHNAVRYTPAGGRVECSVTGSATEVMIAVRDTGPGLDAADREHVFEPFFRGNQIGPGLGIGLALARRIAEMHGGQLTVASDGLDRGSTFTLIVPLAPHRA